MPDTTPTTGSQTVVVRHSALTYVSLGFNALILLLILIGIVCNHHHKKHHERGDWGGGRMEHREFAGRGFGGFHHHGFCEMRGGWGRRGFDGGPCKMDGNQGGPGDWGHHGFGMGQQQGWGNGGKPNFGENHPGFGQNNGGFGGMNGKPMTPPSADEMTTRFMAILTQRLSLTSQESAQVKPIVQSSVEQFQKDMEAQKAAHQKMIDDAKAKVRAVLTPDQQKQFDAMTAMLGGPAAAAPPPASK